MGAVVDFWKNSGTISTRPPTAITSTIRMIIKKLLVSIFSCVKPAAVVLSSFMGCAFLSFLLSGVGQRRDGHPHRSAPGHRHADIPGHDPHAAQVQHPA